MDPKIGKFYPIDDSKNPRRGTVTTFHATEKSWPIFEIGEVVQVKGCSFVVTNIKPSSGRLILKPVAKR